MKYATWIPLPKIHTLLAFKHPMSERDARVWFTITGKRYTGKTPNQERNNDN